MSSCKECKNSGYCTWCGGTGSDRRASLCRSCQGSGYCLSCGGAQRKKKSNDQYEDIKFLKGIRKA